MANTEDTTGDEPFVERRRPSEPRSFPGGQVRLPRINRPAGAPPQDLTQEEPLRRNVNERSPSKDRGFEAYYSSESLFDRTIEGPADTEEGPYGVLGLRRSATWEQVAKAHRKLVAQLHPDRYVGEDDTVRAAAERRVRDVNEAYATIRRQRAVQRA